MLLLMSGLCQADEYRCWLNGFSGSNIVASVPSGSEEGKIISGNISATAEYLIDGLNNVWVYGPNGRYRFEVRPEGFGYIFDMARTADDEGLIRAISTFTSCKYVSSEDIVREKLLIRKNEEKELNYRSEVESFDLQHELQRVSPVGDDVVARMLREAVESESDPELRMLLWKQYLQYRGS